MNLREISLSIYSFGYSCGFVRQGCAETLAPAVTIENIADLARQYGLGGIEFPIDRYYGISDLWKADDFIAGLLRSGICVTIDLENFDVPYLLALLPILARNQLRFVRIKMAGFYGGNRYREPDFERHVSAFISGLRSLLPELRDRGLRLLIENHQDLGAEDLIGIIGATSADCVGINWDIGNSLAVVDTPEGFLRKAGGFIGNVHLKDYRIFRCRNGFYLARCALGEGVVNFSLLLSALREQQGAVPMSIELGAQRARRADVFEKAYWEAYRPYTVRDTIEFFSFLNNRLLEGNGWKSAWDLGLSGEAIVESEMGDLERSVVFLKELKL